MGLDDIDEDEPTLVPPRPSPGAASALDDLFGGLGAAAKTAPTANAQATTAGAPPPRVSDPLDALFAPASNTPTPGVAKPAPSDNLLDFAAAAPQPKQHARTMDDIFTSIDRRLAGADAADNGPALLGQLGSPQPAAYVPPRSLLATMTAYELVGVAQQASPEQISRAYRQKALGLHPDKRAAQGNPLSADEAAYFEHLTQAHEVLADPQQRVAYDQQLRAHEGGAGAGHWLSHVA